MPKAKLKGKSGTVVEYVEQSNSVIHIQMPQVSFTITKKEFEQYYEVLPEGEPGKE